MEKTQKCTWCGKTYNQTEIIEVWGSTAEEKAYICMECIRNLEPATEQKQAKT